MKFLIRYVLAFVGCVFLYSCHHTQAEEESVKDITLSESEISVFSGRTVRLSVTILPESLNDVTINWRSLSPEVASVDSEGLVTALSLGEAIIVAAAGGKSSACLIHVVSEEGVAVTSISLDRKSLVLPAGESKALIATVLPTNATDPSVTWSSSAPEVASVQEGTVTALAEGTATITAEASGLSASCLVTVIPKGLGTNEIWYTSWIDKAIGIGSEDGCGARLVSNEFKDGKGVLTFDGPVTVIPSSMFKGNAALKSITIPSSVTELAYQAFEDCSTMLSITMQEGIKIIGANAFQNCFSLRKLLIPSTLEIIGSFAIRSCNALQELVVPENVSSLDEFALYGCSSLKSLTFLSDKPCSIGFRALDETGDCPILVPAASVEKYRSAAGWKDYASRIKSIE